MQVSKGIIIEMLRLRGDHACASKVDAALPDTVDTTKDAQKLGDCGIDPREMLNRLPPAAVHPR
jgi:hypothetical protein